MVVSTQYPSSIFYCSKEFYEVGYNGVQSRPQTLDHVCLLILLCRYVWCFYIVWLRMIRHIDTTLCTYRSITCIVPSKTINHSIKPQRSQTKTFGKQKTVSQDDRLRARSKIWKNPPPSCIQLCTRPLQKRVSAVLSQVADGAVVPRPQERRSSTTWQRSSRPHRPFHLLHFSSWETRWRTGRRCRKGREGGR